MMLLLGVACVIAVIIMFAARKSSGVVTVNPKAGPGDASPIGPIPHDMEEVKHLAAAGRTIDAIKLFRELTGADLAASKTAVELIAKAGAGAHVNVNVHVEKRHVELPPQVKELVRAGNTIEAIKLVRETTGCSLIIAKDVVDRIAAQL